MRGPEPRAGQEPVVVPRSVNQSTGQKQGITISIMFRKRQEQPTAGQTLGRPSALEVTSRYVAALSAGDSQAMNALRSADFALDFVYGDAFEDCPLSEEDTKQFWPAWFTAFSDSDYEVTRTIAAAEVVVTQWIFTGTNTGPLGPPILEQRFERTGKTIRIRGVSVYDIRDGAIQRESAYIDLATVMVELGLQL